MGWRTDQAYEDARNAEYREWLRSLPVHRRLGHHARQVVMMALFLGIFGVFFWAMIGAPR